MAPASLSVAGAVTAEPPPEGVRPETSPPLRLLSGPLSDVASAMDQGYELLPGSARG